MKIKGLRSEHVELEVPPSHAIDALYKELLSRMEVPPNSFLRNGLWENYEFYGRGSPEKTIIRKASEWEVEIFGHLEALKKVDWDNIPSALEGGEM